MKLSVSVIIPTYNESGYLDKCLESVLCQTVNDMVCEILVVDNLSTDGTRELAHALGAKVLINDKLGAAASRNLGADCAQGEILAFVDADCILDPYWLEKLACCLKLTGASAVAARAVPVYDNMTWVETGWFEVFVGKRRGNTQELTRVSSLGSSNLLMNKQLFQKVGSFDDKMLSCEDYDLSQRLSKLGDLVVVEDVRVTHLRESKTIYELIKREISRGRYSLRCLVKNRYSFREVPSVGIPALTILNVIIIMATPIFNKYYITLLATIMIIMMPIIYIIKQNMSLTRFNIIVYGYIVSFAYILARSIALLKEIGDICLNSQKQRGK